MYCKKCYTSLRLSTDTGVCPRCGRKFDPARPRTYLTRPFPTKLNMFLALLLTTALGIGAAYVVAFQQMAGASGH